MNTITKFFTRYALLAALFVMSSGTAFAQNTPGGGNPGGGNTPGGGNPGGMDGCGGTGGLVNPLNGVCSLDDFLGAILLGVIRIGTIVLIMMLVYVGFLFVASRGNAEKLQGAKSALVWTVIGGLILLGATAIQMAITGTVNSITNP